MSFQELPKVKNINRKFNIPELKEELRNSLLINSSFNIGNEQKSFKKQITDEVLKKVSQTIVSLHSTLVPKTQNIQIYRDLTQDQQQMLKIVQDVKLIHTILAGVLAIDSCLKHIHRQETYIISSLLKGVTICLGNFRKVEEQFSLATSGKISQNFLKFFDSLKLIISDIHKIPAAKIKKTQLERHTQFICKSKMNTQLSNIQNREQNLLFSMLAQQNNSMRIKLNQLQKELIQVQKQKQQITKSTKSFQSIEKKKRSSENYLTQTGSQSIKGLHQQTLIRELKDQIFQKNQIIAKMNDEFALQIEKFQKVFKRLEEQNKILKKYNDFDTAYILEELEYEVQMLRQQKRNDQKIINQIMFKMDRMSWNRNQVDSSVLQNYPKQKSVYNVRSDLKGRIGQAKNLQIKRSRCPSVSPSNKQQNPINRYFSPNYDIRDRNERQTIFGLTGCERRQSYQKYKRESSPRFGQAQQQNKYQNLQEKLAKNKLQRQRQQMQLLIHRDQLANDPRQVRKSRSKLNEVMIPGFQSNFERNRMRKQMRRSKFLNQQITYK